MRVSKSLSFRKLYSGTLAQQMRRKTLTFFMEIER